MTGAGYDIFKRAIDVAIASSGLILSSPLLGLAALLIKAEDGGPVLFSQERVGINAKPFTIYKLRTMAVDYASTEQVFDDSAGVTRVGRLLRRTKFDEVPQLWNVARGDMSLIGPRPCLPSTALEMPEWALLRFQVRPGITGLAQVKGNAAIPWYRRWRLDVEYVEKMSWLTDAKIVLKTFETIVLGEQRISARTRP